MGNFPLYNLWPQVVGLYLNHVLYIFFFPYDFAFILRRVCTGYTGRWKPCLVGLPFFPLTFSPAEWFWKFRHKAFPLGVSQTWVGFCFWPALWNGRSGVHDSSSLVLSFQGKPVFMSLSTRCFDSSAGKHWPNVYVGTVLCHLLIYFRSIVTLLFCLLVQNENSSPLARQLRQTSICLLEGNICNQHKMCPVGRGNPWLAWNEVMDVSQVVFQFRHSNPRDGAHLHFYGSQAILKDL